MGQITDKTEVPSISLLPKGVDGEGVRAEGWLCRFDESDMEGDTFSIVGMKAALDSFMDRNPVALLNHKRSEVPIGKVTKAEVRPEGVWGAVVIPKQDYGRGREAYEAVKHGLLRGFSLSGMWERMNVAGKATLFTKRIVEVSLATVPVGEGAVSLGAPAVVGVKALGDSWVSADDYDAIQADAMDWLRQERARKMADGLQLRRDVRKMQLAALRNTVDSLR